MLLCACNSAFFWNFHFFARFIHEKLQLKCVHEEEEVEYNRQWNSIRYFNKNTYYHFFQFQFPVCHFLLKCTPRALCSNWEAKSSVESACFLFTTLSLSIPYFMPPRALRSDTSWNLQNNNFMNQWAGKFWFKKYSCTQENLFIFEKSLNLRIVFFLVVMCRRNIIINAVCASKLI